MKPNLPPASKRARSGFSLIATLSMMLLITLIALGLLSLSTVTIRSSNAGAAMATARANARLSVMLALGDLQRFAGPDQRTTAAADQLSLMAKRGGEAKEQQVAQPRWVGVWPTAVQGKTKPGFLVGRYDGGTDGENYLVDLREPTTPNSGDAAFDANRSEFKDKGSLGWLVSSGGESISPLNFASDENSVLLLGRSWTGNPQLAAKQVRVPLVKTGNGNADRGAYGYWVEDENAKANIAVVSRHGKNDTARSISQTAPADLVDTALKGHQDLVRNQDRSIGNLVSLETAALLSLTGGSNPAKMRELLAEHEQDLTVYSESLLTNPQTGGFQQDLSAFLALPGTINSSNYGSSLNQGFDADAVSGAPQLKAGDPLVYGERHKITSPKVGALKAWADLSQVVSGSGAAASINVQVPPSRNLSGQTNAVAGFLPDITQIVPQAIHPVMTECSLGWDFTRLPGTGGVDGLRVHLYPRVVLWNPYNVQINTAPYLVMMRLPYYGSLTVNGSAIRNGDGSRFYLRNAAGNPTENFAGFVIEPTAIPAGQALVFTASPFNRGDAIAGAAMPFDTANYAKNVLTCRQPPGPENFYRELRPGTGSANTEVFYTDGAGAKVAGIPATYRAQYGFGGDSNNFYSDSNSKADQYILKAINGNSVVSSLTWADATSATYPAIQDIIAQVTGTDGYAKWWSAQNNDHASNGGSAFGEFSTAVRPPRLWRRGVKLRWFNDIDEYNAFARPAQGTSPFNANWTAEYNLRAGLVHTAWLGANSNFTSSNKGSWVSGDPGPYIYMWSPKANWEPSNPAMSVGGQFCYSPFGTTNQFPGTSYPFFEIPRANEPILSLARFQHAELSYQTYHPSYVVANSEQDVRSERAATVVRPGKSGTVTTNSGDDIGNGDIWHPGHYLLVQKGSGGNTHSNDILLYDMPFEVNHRLFDNYFLSGLPFTGNRSSWDTEKELPNDRLRFLTSSKRTPESVKSSLNKGGGLDYAFHQAGTFLGNEGALNVNSTSIAAWTAHLSGLRNLAREALDGASSQTGSSFSRMEYPVSGVGSADQSFNSPAAWNSFRRLTDDDLKNLATAIVTEVKLRGPFVSLSDFVNRRLVQPPSGAKSLPYEDPVKYSLESTGKIGALGAAIYRAGLNRGLEDAPDASGAVATRFGRSERAFTQSDLDSGYYVFGSQPSFKTSGLPGYLTQGDLLTAIAPTLTARGDTFSIRGYGEARDATGKTILARAWCEVVVQRMPDYVDSTDDPSERTLVPASNNASSPDLKINDKLSDANRRFGRKFNLVNFRWLSESEV